MYWWQYIKEEDKNEWVKKSFLKKKKKSNDILVNNLTFGVNRANENSIKHELYEVFELYLKKKIPHL